MLLLDQKQYIIPETIRKDYYEKAVFVIHPNKIIWDDLNNRFDVPRVEGIPIEYNMMMDFMDGNGMRTGKLRYFDSERPYPGKETMRIYEPPFLHLYNGTLELEEEEYEKIFFLRNHANNLSNPKRGTKMGIFQTFDWKDVYEKDQDSFVAIQKAMSFVEGEDAKDIFALKAIAAEIERDTASKLDHQIGNSAAMGESQLRFVLRRFAKKYPVQMLQYFSKSATLIRHDIEQFKDARILEYRGGERGNIKGSWIFHTGVEKNPEIEVCSVMKGHEATETLINVFKNDDKAGMYKKINAAFKKSQNILA